jgi:hypothetical protein
MNKGSNPVGVAKQEGSENAVEQDVQERQTHVVPDQTSSDLTQGRHKEGGGPRKRPKAGLCKRRGCKEPVADTEKRLCSGHLGQPATVGAEPVAEVAEDDTAETHLTDHLALKGFTGCPPIPGQVVEVFYGTEREPWRRGTVEAVTAEGFVVGGVMYLQREECETWRWPAMDRCPVDANPCEGQGTNVQCAACLEAQPISTGKTALATTYGKNGIPELPAIPEEVEQPNDKQPADPEVCPEVCVGPQLPGLCRGCREEQRGALAVRTCVGIPGAVGDARCNCILGEDVKGDRCSRCQAAVAEAEQAQREEEERAERAVLAGAGLTDLLCANSGCTRGHAIDSRYCDKHRKVAEAVAYIALDHAFEAAWADLLGSPHLDRKTVEVCKALRDKEVSL